MSHTLMIASSYDTQSGKPIFSYTAIHVPTGKTFERSAICIDRTHFLEYINAWNHNNGEWRYLASLYHSSYPHPVNVTLPQGNN